MPLIGKTRPNAGKNSGWLTSDVGAPRGILNSLPETGEIRVAHRQPARQVSSFIEYYWIVVWDLRDHLTHVQETLPHPNVHVVFERNNSLVFGLVTGKFSRLLEGRSRAVGVKFAPAMFRSSLGIPVSQITDRSVPVRAVFGSDSTSLEGTLLSEIEDDEIVNAADCFFQSRIPKVDSNADLAKALVREVLCRRDLLTVEHLARLSGLGMRSLQRLFSEYVGVSPKWVIRRYRLHEAVERIRSGEFANYPQLAQELGYFDQAHLINDFKSIIGYAPTELRRS